MRMRKNIRDSIAMVFVLGLLILCGLKTEAATVQVQIKGKCLYSVANECLAQINKKRAAKGYSPVKMDASLQEQALVLAMKNPVDFTLPKETSNTTWYDADTNYFDGDFTIPDNKEFFKDYPTYENPVPTVAKEELLENFDAGFSDSISGIKSVGIVFFAVYETDKNVPYGISYGFVESKNDCKTVSSKSGISEVTKSVSISNSSHVLSPGAGGSGDQYDNASYPLNCKNGDSYRNKYLQVGHSVQLDVHLLNMNKFAYGSHSLGWPMRKVINGGTYYRQSLKLIPFSVSWSTSNAGVATVNSSGVVTAKGVGTAYITASLGGMSTKYRIMTSSGSPTTIKQYHPLINIGGSAERLYVDGKQYKGYTKGYEFYGSTGGMNGQYYSSSYGSSRKMIADFGKYEYYCCDGKDSNGKKGCSHGHTVPHLIKASDIKQDKSTTKKTAKNTTKKVTSGGMRLQINTKTKTAVYIAPTGSKASVTIPAAVKIGKKNYKVTSIAKGAFQNQKLLKKVTIGTNVTSIGDRAFYGCSKLSSIRIKTTRLKKVGRNAITGISKKAKIQVPKKKRKAYNKLFKARTGFRKTMKIK